MRADRSSGSSIASLPGTTDLYAALRAPVGFLGEVCRSPLNSEVYRSSRNFAPRSRQQQRDRDDDQVSEDHLPTLRPGDIVVMDNLGPQGQDRASAHSLSRRQALLPAKILAQPEPDRTGLCQAQTSASKGSRTNRRYGLHRNRRNSTSLHARGMRQPFRKFGISKLMSSGFPTSKRSGLAFPRRRDIRCACEPRRSRIWAEVWASRQRRPQKPYKQRNFGLVWRRGRDFHL